MLAVSPQRLNKILKTEKHVYFDLLVEMGVPELGRLGKVGMYETIKRDLENSLTLPSPCPPTLAVHHHHIWVLVNRQHREELNKEEMGEMPFISVNEPKDLSWFSQRSHVNTLEVLLIHLGRFSRLLEMGFDTIMDVVSVAMLSFRWTRLEAEILPWGVQFKPDGVTPS